jgi:hypothetical protein
MLTNRQYILCKRYAECFAELETSWDRELVRIGHSHRLDVLGLLTKLRDSLATCRPWLMTEKGLRQRIEKMSAPVRAVDLVLNPDVQGGKSLAHDLENIQEKLPMAWTDYLPFSGALRFLWRA